MASIERVTSLLKEEDHVRYAWSKLAGTPLEELRKAAVLIPLVVRDGEVYVWLTLRSKAVTHDPGNVSFPGGMRDDCDENEVDTCLRESNEEIGLERHHVQIVGQTFPRFNARGILITPVIGIVSPEFVPNANEEVDLAFQLPMKRFLMADRHYKTTFSVNGTELLIHHFTDTIENREIHTWGLTAQMCLELAILLFRQAPDFEEQTGSFSALNIDNPYERQHLYLNLFLKQTTEGHIHAHENSLESKL